MWCQWGFCCQKRKGLHTSQVVCDGGKCVCLGLHQRTQLHTHTFGSRRAHSGSGPSFFEPLLTHFLVFDLLLVVSSLIDFSVRRARALNVSFCNKVLCVVSPRAGFNLYFICFGLVLELGAKGVLVQTTPPAGMIDEGRVKP